MSYRLELYHRDFRYIYQQISPLPRRGSNQAPTNRTIRDMPASFDLLLDHGRPGSTAPIQRDGVFSSVRVVRRKIHPWIDPHQPILPFDPFVSIYINPDSRDGLAGLIDYTVIAAR